LASADPELELARAMVTAPAQVRASAAVLELESGWALRPD
jgi:hypothetical protein